MDFNGFWNTCLLLLEDREHWPVEEIWLLNYTLIDILMIFSNQEEFDPSIELSKKNYS